MADVNYEIVEHIGTFARKENGSTQQLNLMRWGSAQPKYDIRNWSPAGSPWKGISIDKEDMESLLILLEGLPKYE